MEQFLSMNILYHFYVRLDFFISVSFSSKIRICLSWKISSVDTRANVKMACSTKVTNRTQNCTTYMQVHTLPCYTDQKEYGMANAHNNNSDIPFAKALSPGAERAVQD